MRITGFELYHVAVPFKDLFFIAWIPGYAMTHHVFDVLRVFTDEGIEGFSAATAIDWERKGLGDVLAPFLIDRDPEDLEGTQEALRQLHYMGFRNMWVDAAIYDILAKKAGKPLYEMLGGKPAALPVYISTGENLEASQRVDKMMPLIEQGHNAFKLRTKNLELEDDVKLIEGVRKGVGDDIMIACDANQGWRLSLVKENPVWDLDRAKEFAKACADNGIEWLEEPLHPLDYEGNAALRKEANVKIAGGEINNSWDDVKVMFEHDCFDVYQPDACFSGGVYQTLKIVEECKKRDKIFTPHMWGNGISIFINWNMKLVSGDKRLPVEYVYEAPAFTQEYRDGVVEPVMLDENNLLPPFTEPGIGCRVDMKLLKKYGTCYSRMNQRRLTLKVIRDRGLKRALELKKIMDGAG